VKSRRARVFILAVILAAVGVFVWRDVLHRNGVAPGTLAGNGTIEATEVEVSAKVSGRIARLEAREGGLVRKGQVIAVLEAADLTGQVEQARGNLAAAEAALAEVRAGTREEDLRRARATLDASEMAVKQAWARLELVRAGARREVIGQLRAALLQAEVAMTDAETEFQRAVRLEGQGAIPGRDLDAARTRRDTVVALYDQSVERLAEAEAGSRPEEVRQAEAAVSQADAQVRVARASLDLAVAGPRKETIAGAAARVEQARGTLSAVESLLAETTVTAPLDATVTLRNSEPGEVVTPGFPIVRLADLSTVFLRVYVPEPQVGLVKPGQDASVTVDTFPGRSFAGRVVEISQKPEFTPKNVQTKEERVKLVFGVKVEVANPQLDLKPGMPADAVIRTGTR
jgi:HlyD family secretion protein